MYDSSPAELVTLDVDCALLYGEQLAVLGEKGPVSGPLGGVGGEGAVRQIGFGVAHAGSVERRGRDQSLIYD